MYVISKSYYKLTKKLYMSSIIGSSGRDFVLIILFQFYGSKDGLSESYLFWVGQCATRNLHIGKRTEPILT